MYGNHHRVLERSSLSISGSFVFSIHPNLNEEIYFFFGKNKIVYIVNQNDGPRPTTTACPDLPQSIKVRSVH